MSENLTNEEAKQLAISKISEALEIADNYGLSLYVGSDLYYGKNHPDFTELAERIANGDYESGLSYHGVGEGIWYNSKGTC